MARKNPWGVAIAACALAVCAAAHAQPRNDLCVNADPVGEGSFAFDNTLATTDDLFAAFCATPPPGAIDARSGKDVWFLYTPTFNGRARVRTCASAGPTNAIPDTVISFHFGCGEFNFDCDDDGCGGTSLLSSKILDVAQGQPILIRVAGWGGYDNEPIAFGTGVLTIEQFVQGPPVNDLCANATPVGEGVFPFDNSQATGALSFVCEATTKDVWYLYTPSFTGTARVDTCGSPATGLLDTVISAHESCATFPAWIGASCNDNNCGDLSSMFLSVTQGQPVLIRVAAWLTTIGSDGELSIQPATIGPPPNCPSATQTVTLTNMASAGPVGSPGNSVEVRTLAGGATISKLRVTGRLVGSVYNNEARLSVRGPSGTTYFLQPIPFNFTNTSPRDVTDYEFVIPGAGESLAGQWRFETFDTIDDAQNPDGTWTTLCVGLVSEPTAPAGSATTNFAWNAASGALGGPGATLRVSVTPGALPTSTGLAVAVNGGAIGLGTLNLTDPDADFVFTTSISVSGVAPGTYVLPFNVSDAQGRTAPGTLDLQVNPGAVDLGVMTGDTDGLLADSVVIAPGSIQWYRFALSSPIDATRHLDMHTNASLNDTVLTLFDGAGTLIATDEDDGFVNRSLLTFGTGSGQFLGSVGPFDTQPINADGRDGVGLAPGEYYLSVGRSLVAVGNGFRADASSGNLTHDLTFITNAVAGPTCDSIDFNGDGVFPDLQDVVEFFFVFGGGACTTGTCNDIDFNNDGVFPDLQDVVKYLDVFGGGNC
jgi:hypothetical protein